MSDFQEQGRPHHVSFETFSQFSSKVDRNFDAMQKSFQGLEVLVKDMAAKQTKLDETLRANEEESFTFAQRSSPGITPHPKKQISSEVEVKSNHGSLKLPTPESFSGQMGTSASVVLGFVSSVEMYLKAAGCDLDGARSLDISVLYLKSNALQWYEFYVKRNPDQITSWKTLKTAILDRFITRSQGQVSLESLLRISYRGNISLYNEVFLKHLVHVNTLNDSATDDVTMGIYINGIKGPGTTYLLTTLRNAVQEKKAKNVNDLMHIALLAEANLKSSSSASVAARSAVSAVPSVGPKFSGSSSSSSSGSSPFRFRTPPRNSGDLNVLSYESELAVEPVLHNVQSDDSEYKDENECMEEDNNVEEEDNDIFLNAIRQFNDVKKTQPNMSPEVFEQRRKNKLCFKCGRPGHFRKDCKA
jgi:hypothetical protein